MNILLNEQVIIGKNNINPLVFFFFGQKTIPLVS